MSPHAEAYLLGAISLVSWAKYAQSMAFHGLVFIPRSKEYLTQEVFERMIRALNRPPLLSRKAPQQCT